MDRIKFDKEANKAKFKKLTVERFAVKEGTELTLSGYCVVFNVLSTDRGGYVVSIPPGSMKLPDYDVVALYNHDDSHILGRVSNGSLSFSEDATGLLVTITLADTQYNRDLYAQVQRQDIKGMSFGAYPLKTRAEKRTITEADVAPDSGLTAYIGKELDVEHYEEWLLDEVTVTGLPAFPQTTLEVADSKPAEPKEEPKAEEAPVEEAAAYSKTPAGEALHANFAKEGTANQTPEQTDNGKDAGRVSISPTQTELLQSNAEIKAAIFSSFGTPKGKDKMDIIVNDSNELLRKQVEGFKAFGRGALRSEADYEKFALTSGGNSGVLMPKAAYPSLGIRTVSNSFRKGFAALNVATLTTSVTDNMTLPVIDDSSNVANNDQEGATSGVNLDPTYSASVVLDLKEYHSKAAWVSKKVASASDFDITQRMYPLLVNRIERQEQADWTAAVIAKGAGIVGKTAAGTTAVTLPELIDFDESFSAAYDETTVFYMISKAAKAAIRKLADTTNVPFFGVENGLTTLFGKPVFVNTSLGAMTTGQTILMGISSDGAVIRDATANEVVQYTNIPQYPGQIGYEAIGFSAFDCTASSVRTLKLA